MNLTVGAIIIGDEILSGRRADKHLPKLIGLLAARGLRLSWARYLGDDPKRLTQALTEALAGSDLVFSFGGIGATPDDHTRQCAGMALGEPLVLHPQAKALITERMQETAAEQGVAFDPDAADNVHRLNMGCFPRSARIIPNPYNKIPGFSCDGMGGSTVHFVPGFPVMAWPMIEWVLDQHYSQHFAQDTWVERSVVVYGAIEAKLTPLMLELEAQFEGVKIFSLPSVDHPVHGRHIELGVKGELESVNAAYAHMVESLQQLGAPVGPELVQTKCT
jgi:molybdopterin-biosynthesis enzyme MoeA-like protein